MVDRRRVIGVAAIVLASASYATGPLFAKAGVYEADVDWLTLLTWRFLIGAALSWVWVLAVPGNLTALRSMPQRRVLVALGLGAFFVGNAGTYYAALQTVDASLAAVLLYIYPVLVAVLSIRLGASLAGARPWVALAVAIGGAILAVGGISATRVPPISGLTLAIASPIIYSVYIVLTARLAGERRGRLPGPSGSTMGDHAAGEDASAGAGAAGQRTATPAAPIAALMLTATAAVCLVLAVVSERPFLPGQIPAAAWPGLIGIGVISTAVAIQAFYAGTSRIGAAQAALVATMEPIWTITLATLFLGESLTPVQLVGGGLVIGAVLLAQTTPGLAAPTVREE